MDQWGGEDDNEWLITNFIADEELEVAQRLLSVGGDEDSDDGEARQRRRVIERGVADGHANLVRDYIGINAVYKSAMFERRFLLPHDLFTKVVAAFAERGYMKQGVDALGKRGPSREQKILCALRMLQTGSAADAMDDYFRMGDTTAREAMKVFCAYVDELFGNHFLRWPTVDDLKRLYDTNAARGFPGMIGSLNPKIAIHSAASISLDHVIWCTLLPF